MSWMCFRRSGTSPTESSRQQILVDKNDPNAAFIDETESAVGRGSFDIFAWSMLTLGSALVIIAMVRLIRMHRGRRIDSADATPAQ